MTDPTTAPTSHEQALPPWGLREALWGLLLAAVLVAATIGLLAGVSRLLHLGRDAARSDHLAGVFLSLGEAVLLIPVWALARRRGASWAQLGVRRFRPLIGCLGTAGLFCLALWINLAWNLALRALHWSGQPALAPLFGQGPLGVALAFLGVSIIAPLSEEIFFRGFVFPPLRRRLGFVLGAGLNALLFALLHFTPTVLPPLLFLGVAFCLLYEYSGSLWPGIILHACINTMSLLSALLLVRDA